jgi:hypothetical protein
MPFAQRKDADENIATCQLHRVCPHSASERNAQSIDQEQQGEFHRLLLLGLQDHQNLFLIANK